MKPDDIIVAMNDHPVKDGEELVTKVADLPIGSSTTFTVDRNGKRLDLTMEVAERAVVWQGEAQLSESRPAPTSGASHGINPSKFGITIMRLTQKERQDLAIEDKSGVKVVTVDPGSFAEDIGLQEGDAILSVNRQSVTSPDEVMRVQSTFKAGQAVALRIARAPAGRHGQPQRTYLAGRLPAD